MYMYLYMYMYMYICTHEEPLYPVYPHFLGSSYPCASLGTADTDAQVNLIMMAAQLQYHGMRSLVTEIISAPDIS